MYFTRHETKPQQSNAPSENGAKEDVQQCENLLWEISEYNEVLINLGYRTLLVHEQRNKAAPWLLRVLQLQKGLHDYQYHFEICLRYPVL